MGNTYIMIDNKRVSCEYSAIDLNLVDLDPKNPRLATFLDGRIGDISQEYLQEILIGKKPVRELMYAIIENGGLIEPVIAIKKAGRYVVYEGNCRIACLKEIVNVKKLDGFGSVPAMVVDEANMNSEEKAVLLCGIHVTPKIQWAPYDKARLVDELLHVHNKSRSWVGSHLRMNLVNVDIFIAAYENTKKFLQGDTEKTVKIFSHFHEFFKKPFLNKKGSEDPFFLEYFHSWVKAGKFRDALQIRKLPEVLSSKEAYARFIETNFDEAYDLLRKTQPEKAIPVLRSVRNLAKRLNKISDKDWEQITEAGSSSLKSLVYLSKAIERTTDKVSDFVAVEH